MSSRQDNDHERIQKVEEKKNDKQRTFYSIFRKQKLQEGQSFSSKNERYRYCFPSRIT